LAPPGLTSAWCSLPTGRPIEPRNLVRSFARIRDSNGIRKIRLHAIRHTTALLLKDLDVPARDAQIILGHAHISTTRLLAASTARAIFKASDVVAGLHGAMARHGRPERMLTDIQDGWCPGKRCTVRPVV
jgi:Phage integrase family